MIDNFIFFSFEKISRCAKANNLNDAMMVVYTHKHAHRLMLMINGDETRREKEANRKEASQHKKFHSFY